MLPVVSVVMANKRLFWEKIHRQSPRQPSQISTDEELPDKLDERGKGGKLLPATWATQTPTRATAALVTRKRSKIWTHRERRKGLAKKNFCFLTEIQLWLLWSGQNAHNYRFVSISADYALMMVRPYLQQWCALCATTYSTLFNSLPATFRPEKKRFLSGPETAERNNDKMLFFGDRW